MSDSQLPDQLAHQHAQQCALVQDQSNAIAGSLSKLEVKLEYMSEAQATQWMEVKHNLEHLQKAVTPNNPPTLSLVDKLAAVKGMRLATHAAPPVYVPLLCGTTRISSDASSDGEAKDEMLEERIVSILAGAAAGAAAAAPDTIPDDKTLCSILLLGPSGAGKSFALRNIERRLWQELVIHADEDAFGHKTQYVPLFGALRDANLPHFQGAPLLDVVLQEVSSGILTRQDLTELKKLKVYPIWILDGYDEMNTIRPMASILREAGLSLLSCRRQFVDGILRGDLKTFLLPKKNAQASTSHVLYVRPFTPSQMYDYVSKALASDHALARVGGAEVVMRAIQTIPSLNEWCTNPFMLSLVVQQLPGSALGVPHLQDTLSGTATKAGRSSDATTHTRSIKSTDILRTFVHDYYVKCMEKFCEAPSWPTNFAPVFVSQCETLCRELAVKMFERGVLVANSRDEAFSSLFPSDLTTPEGIKHSFILRSVPLVSVDSIHWSFMHKSLWEYYLACASVCNGSTGEGRSTPADEGITLIQHPPHSALISTLGRRLFTQDRDLLHKHAELIADRPSAKQAFIDLVLATRLKDSDPAADERLVVAASNAISVLNYGGLSGIFSFRFADFRDWSGIRVPHANLNYAQILSCSFDQSDLSYCTMFQAALRGSTFRGANLVGTDTGEKAPLLGHTKLVSSISFSPDNTMLASASWDQTIRLWNVTTRDCIATLYGHHSFVYTLSFSPDGRLIASGGQDKVIRLWNVASRECVAVLEGHKDYIRSVCFSPDNRLVASGSDDMSVHIWELSSNARRATFQGQTGEICSVQFSPDSRLIASASNDGSTWIWHVNSEECLVKLTGHVSSIKCVAFSPDQVLLASASRDNSIRLWNLESGTCVSTLLGHTRAVTSVAFDSSSRLLVSGSDDTTVRFWDVPTGQCVATFRGHTQSVHCVQFRPDAKLVASASADGWIRLWDVSFGGCTANIFVHVLEVGYVSFSPTAPNLLATCSGTHVTLWDVKSALRLCTLRGHTSWVNCCVFSPTGQSLVSGADDCTIRLWNPQTAECQATLTTKQDRSRIMSVNLTSDGVLLAAGLATGSVELWNLRSREHIAMLTGHTSLVREVSFSPMRASSPPDHLTNQLRSGAFPRMPA